MNNQEKLKKLIIKLEFTEKKILNCKQIIRRAAFHIRCSKRLGLDRPFEDIRNKRIIVNQTEAEDTYKQLKEQCYEQLSILTQLEGKDTPFVEIPIQDSELKIIL